MFPTSAEVWESREPEIMRTSAGMASRALEAKLERFFADGCLFDPPPPPERVPLFLDLEADLFLDFGGDCFWDRCFFGPGRPLLLSCGVRDDLELGGDGLGLDLLRLRPPPPPPLPSSLFPDDDFLLSIERIERLSFRSPSPLGLDLLLERRPVR